MQAVKRGTPTYDEEAWQITQEAGDAFEDKGIMAYPVIRRAAKWYEDKAEHYRQEPSTKYTAKLKKDLSTKGGQATKKVIARIDKVHAQPIMYLKRDRKDRKARQRAL